MMPPLLIAFVLSFAVGPLLFLLLIQPDPTKPLLAALAIGALAAALLGASLFDRSPLSGLAAVWLGWVSAVAFIAHAARRMMHRPRTDLATRVAGSLATTIPWFGLATAQMLSS
ncbi:hypothetical protein FIU97_17575 [Roseivivax sp. THAF40]|uniref:hypothetical protein n=1 Tax=unclassified Roseivivax TaxID=2639302 RepID=UPI0012686206|nr:MULTISPECIES: hypothetical protein [unclassified Roseivivax]QFS84572.1 hypothetical protein FIV09_17165 [Roseivivax sp. THAF197b]QFT48399.1 hypothetical protein FIU97_17575 [Roseivivax sp. THAF40]